MRKYNRIRELIKSNSELWRKIQAHEQQEDRK